MTTQQRLESEAREWAKGKYNITDDEWDQCFVSKGAFIAGALSEHKRAGELVEALKVAIEALWDAYNETDALLNGGGPSDLVAVCEHTKHGHSVAREALKRWEGGE